MSWNDFVVYGTWLLTVINLGIRIAALFIVPVDRKPQTAMAWLLLIFLFPIGGLLLFWLFGVNKLPKHRRQKQSEINAIIAESMVQPKIAERRGQPDWLESAARLNRELGAMPLVGGNSPVFHADYENSLAAMTAAIKSAKKSVHSEFYIMNLDATSKQYFDALGEAAARGVTVRLLVDHIASWRYPGWKKTVKYLDSLGINWQLMLPVKPLKGRWRRPDLRNHRKLLVIDGQRAFTGSQNIIDSSYNKKSNLKRGLHWQDLMVEFTGPVVAGIDGLFVADWYAETDEILPLISAAYSEADQKSGVLAQVVPSGPAFEQENNLRLFNSLIYSAKEKITITSPYFVPDDSMLYAITSAPARGVEVELFVSEIGDQAMVYHAQCSYYETLLRAGVKIFLYQAPTILHAKHFVIDDQVAVFGSSNMDMRSFSLNLEVSVMVYGEEFIIGLTQIINDYRKKSRQLTLEQWLARSKWMQFKNNLGRLTASLQ